MSWLWPAKGRVITQSPGSTAHMHKVLISWFSGIWSYQPHLKIRLDWSCQIFGLKSSNMSQHSPAEVLYRNLLHQDLKAFKLPATAGARSLTKEIEDLNRSSIAGVCSLVVLLWEELIWKPESCLFQGGSWSTVCLVVRKGRVVDF